MVSTCATTTHTNRPHQQQQQTAAAPLPKGRSLFTRVILPVTLSVAALYVWQQYRGYPDSSDLQSTLQGAFRDHDNTNSKSNGSDSAMLAITRRGLAAASASGANALKSLVAVGLHSEFTPPWPMPLPDPLPKNKNKHTLVLDIDETLIHTYGMTKHVAGSTEKTPEDKELAGQVQLVDYSMLVRPHLKEFLTEVNELYEVVFWTAGTAAYCAAVLDAIERHVLGMHPSFYNYLELIKEQTGKGGPTTANANFFALSRTQTLESKQYMKYMPLLGRSMKGVLMIDDNVRSFPLTPRHGVKIGCFDVDDHLLHYFLHAAGEVQKAGGDTSKIDPRLLIFLEKGGKQLQELEKDTGLLDLLPMLRAVAKVPYGQDVTKELDHWRDLDYTTCDDFKENMNPLSVARTKILGTVLGKRRDEAIPASKGGYMNSSFIEEINSEVKFAQMRPKERSKL